MNKIKLAVINDIHFGIDDSQRIYNELHQFTDFLKSHDIDILVIDGDYFDRKLSVTDTATYLAVSYFNQLFDICKEKNDFCKKIYEFQQGNICKREIQSINEKIINKVRLSTIMNLIKEIYIVRY